MIAKGFAAPPPSPTHWPGDPPGKGPGTDRWWLAIADAELRPPEAAQHFDCVLGTRLAAKPRPALTRLMNRLLVDSARVASVLAEREPRSRPVAVRPDLQPCVRIDEATRATPSWPATGAVAGATYGELFAALAPDRANEARARGAEIGHSRVICRMNWPQDVRAGSHVGRRVYVAATEASDFQTDLEAARAELAAARAEGLTNPSCAAERRALGPMPDGD
ncbi:MAG: PA-phosphatase [Brevundimonas sp.]|nr:PA-phosphatase [Brevundimonas sp.]